MPNLEFEQTAALDGNCMRIAGVDEVGRGPWAGPVIACAVVLPDIMYPYGGLPLETYAALDDSKRLSHARREALETALKARVLYGFGEACVQEIDDLNILQASLLAMRRAVAALPIPPQAALIDGNRDPGLDMPTRLIVKGDCKSASIAAASILAKVHRDRLMSELDREYPEYSWARNKGYGTKAHIDGLNRRGTSCHHRKSFAPIRERIQETL